MRRERRFVVRERAACKFFVAALPTEIGLDDGEPMPILRRLVSCVAEQSNSAGKQRRTFVSRYWFLAMLLLMIPAGLWLPEGGQTIKNAKWATPVLVGMMMGISGLTLDTSKLRRQAASLGAISLVLFSTYCVAPAVAYGLALWLQPAGHPHFLPAVMIMAAQASSLASALALTVLSRGNQELALIFTLLSSSLTVVLTPLVLQLSIGASEKVEIPLGQMIFKMLLVVVMPVALGQALRRFLWAKAKPLLKGIRLVPQLIILVFVYSGFSVATGQINGNADIVLRIVVLSAILHAILLAWNFGVSILFRMDSGTGTALVFCGSQKTLPNGIYLWQNFFGDNPIGALPLALYHLIQLIADTLLVPFLERRNQAETDDQFRIQ
ncbi:bile acid:sodium symporter [Verrucomicrobia bacterium]|nr:bile acid:sodium symporter [Verrucomicrobiota bacterium]